MHGAVPSGTVVNGSDMGDVVVDGTAAIEDPPVAGHSSISLVSIKPHLKGHRKETNSKKRSRGLD